MIGLTSLYLPFILNGSATIGNAAAKTDRQVVDGGVNAIASATGFIANRIRGLQSGHVQEYAIWFLGGALSLTVLIIYLLY